VTPPLPPRGPTIPPIEAQYEDGVRDLESLDYSPVEAAFLCRALRAGGYFLRRQFLAFSGSKAGERVIDFTRRLEQRHHATVTVCHRRTHVYHLISRPLYVAAGCEDRKRARRRRPPASIRTRLMALDVILTHPGVLFLVTSEGRVDWFKWLLLRGDDCLPTRTFRAGAGQPATTRPFAENVMIGVSVARRQRYPSFFYLEGGRAPVLGFGSFLRRYQPLLSRQWKWSVVFVTDAERHAVRARREYRHWAGLDERDRCLDDVARVEAMLQYFRLREAHAAERWRDFTTETFNWFLEKRARLKGEADGLYAHWETKGDAAVWDALIAADGASPLTAEDAFEPVVIADAYPFEPSL
jgi:hypothetical protein